MSRSEWIPARLAECIATINSGVSVNSDDRPRGPGEVGVLKTSAVSAGSFKAHENKVVAKRDRSRIRESVVGGSVLFSRMNTPQLVGESCYIEADDPSLFLPDRLWQIRVDSSRVDPHWLSYVLLEPRVASKIKGLATGTSGSMKNIARSSFLNISVLVPPIGEQRRIAKILDTLDDRIRTAERIITKLGTVKSAVIEDSFRRTNNFRPLHEIADLQVGFAFSSKDFLDGDDGVRLLRGENVGYGRPDWRELRSLNMTSVRFRQYLLSVGDVVIGMDRTFTKSGMRMSVVSADDLPCLLVQRVGRFVPKHVSQEYLRCLLESVEYQGILSTNQKGMDIPHLSKTEILSPLVPIADLSTQDRLAALTSSLREQIDLETTALRRLQMLRSGLMTDLLCGRVRIPAEVTS